MGVIKDYLDALHAHQLAHPGSTETPAAVLTAADAMRAELPPAHFRRALASGRAYVTHVRMAHAAAQRKAMRYTPPPHTCAVLELEQQGDS